MHILLLIMAVLMVCYLSFYRVPRNAENEELPPSSNHEKHFAQIEFLIKSLRQQIEEADLYLSYVHGDKKLEAVRLDPFPEDGFSIGYIAGFGDAYMQSKALSNDGADAAYLTILFMAFYGREHGAKNFRTFLSLSEQQAVTMLTGMSAGGAEYNQLILSLAKDEDKKFLPHLLGDHLLKLYETQMGEHLHMPPNREQQAE